MPPEIPQDLIDRILDEVYHDRATLGVCSLLNSQWRFRARQHLFRRLHIRVEPTIKGDEAPNNLLMVRKKESLDEEQLDYVKTLLVHCHTPLASDLQPLLDLNLGRIRHLHLHLSLQLSDSHVFRMFTKFNTVTYLYLNRFKVTSIRDIATLLSTLPNLEELTLRGWSGSPDYQEGSGEGSLSTPLKIHTLNVDWFGTKRSPDIVSWFGDNLQQLPNLDTIRMYDITRLEKLSAFLTKMGEQLRCLELALATADDGVFRQGLHLQDNSSLRSISVQTGDNIVQFAELIESIKDMEYLKEVVLTARSISLWDDIRHASWKPVDDGLTDPAFKPQLDRLIVRATHASLTSDMIKTVLPRFLAIGGQVQPISNYVDRRTVWKGEFHMRKMWGDEGYREFRGGE